MDIKFRKLEKNDLPVFIKMRMDQLQEEGAEPVFDISSVLYEYYVKHLEDGTFVSWLAEKDGKLIGTSGMSLCERPPYYGNPTGKVGYLSSMYTLKEYRRKGIAKQLLSKVMSEAKEYGCSVVQITASDEGVLLYTDFGFDKNSNFMQYTF
jgi:GNAT superfamily N-acetyltransferase